MNAGSKKSKMTQSLFMMILVASMISSGCCQCPEDWSEFQETCYAVFYVGRDWYGAHEYCQTYDAELVSITSEEENDAVFTLIQSSPSSVWIGYSEVNQEEYRWTDGAVSEYSNWAEGEPNDQNGGEECVTMSALDGTWNDENCGQAFYFVCKEREEAQEPATLPPIIEGKCPDGFISEDFSNKCFRVSGTEEDGARTWDEARAECEALNGELASISSSAEQDFVLLLIEDVTLDVWLGLYDAGDLGWFVWLDNSEMSYGNLAPSSPETENEDCYAMNRDSDNLGEWEKKDCETKILYLCQATREQSAETDPDPFLDQYSDPACPFDHFLYHGQCFKFYAEPQSWDLAGQACAQSSGQLAVTRDLFEVARFTYETAFMGGYESLQAWLGVTYDSSSGEYVTSGGSVVTETFWDIFQPDLQVDSSCVSLAYGAWHDEDCAETFPFFCVSDQLTASSSSSMSAGAVAAIVITVIVVVAIIAVVSFLVVTKRWTFVTDRFQRRNNIEMANNLEEIPTQ